MSYFYFIAVKYSPEGMPPLNHSCPDTAMKELILKRKKRPRLQTTQ
jgi:hypothetical protein